MTLRALRVVVVAMAIAGAIDPSWTTSHPVPVAVAIQSPPTAAGRNAAAAIAQQLSTQLSGRVTFDGAEAAAASVIVGAADVAVSGNVPASVVLRGAAAAANVRLVGAQSPPPVPAGWVATVGATVEAHDMLGEATAIVLERDGLELSRREHTWSRADETATIALPFTPSEGVSRAIVRVIPSDRESTADDNAADVTLASSARRLRVLAHEPRPSWAATFVRRALERDPAFEISTLVRLSKGLAVSAGDPPRVLTLDELMPFDAVVVGAPEELGQSEIAALETFARRRGGAVVLLPDRRPSGRYLGLLPGWRFDEVLVERPLDVVSDGAGAAGPAAPALSAAEIAAPAGNVPSHEVIAVARVDKSARPVVLSRRAGEGRIIFSGALDAWRYRAAHEDAFDRFWLSTIGAAALAAPPRLSLTAEPAVAAPGQPLVIRARIRATEFDRSAAVAAVPPIAARLIAADGTATPLRLWPAGDAGQFEATLRAPQAGRYVIESSAGASTASLPLTIADDARTPAIGRIDEETRARLIASATGGVVASGSDLAPLVEHLRQLAPASRPERVHLARSPLFIASFIVLAAAEWALRRRRGLA